MLTGVPIELEIATKVLEDDTRRAIFETLWREHNGTRVGKREISFEELREAVGVESSSRLAYHLDQMKAPGDQEDSSLEDDGPDDGSPVRHSTASRRVCQEDDRYFMDPILAMRVIQIWALSLPEHEPVESTDVPWSCPICDEGLVATARNHRVDLWCEAHDGPAESIQWAA